MKKSKKTNTRRANSKKRKTFNAKTEAKTVTSGLVAQINSRVEDPSIQVTLQTEVQAARERAFALIGTSRVVLEIVDHVFAAANTVPIVQGSPLDMALRALGPAIVKLRELIGNIHEPQEPQPAQNPNTRSVAFRVDLRPEGGQVFAECFFAKKNEPGEMSGGHGFYPSMQAAIAGCTRSIGSWMEEYFGVANKKHLFKVQVRAMGSTPSPNLPSTGIIFESDSAVVFETDAINAAHANRLAGALQNCTRDNYEVIIVRPEEQVVAEPKPHARVETPSHMQANVIPLEPDGDPSTEDFGSAEWTGG
jgi:hypothetical protein